MTRRGLAIVRRTGTFAVLALLALSLSGDRTSAAGVPATIYGQDPLEVLELTVRPNVVIVLDTSSSMLESQDNENDLSSGDHPRSKLYQGKKTIRRLVELNQDKVSFWFGTYLTAQHELDYIEPGYNRFQYMASAMPATQLTVEGALGDAYTAATPATTVPLLGRGLQSWQIIYPAWNTFYYQEGGATCAAQLPAGTGPNGEKFYARGGKAAPADADIAGSLAADLKAAMNNPAGCSRQNTYDVTYRASTGVFTFTRTLGTTSWRPLWSVNASRPNNIRGAFNAPTSDPAAGNGPFPSSATRPYTLLYRNSVAATVDCGGSGNESKPGCGPAPFGRAQYPTPALRDGLQSFWFFREEVPEGSGNLVPFWQVGASRYWNGETIYVTSKGEACNIVFATPTSKTNPASVTLQAADASCNPQTASARFEFAGAKVRGEADTDCKGFRTRHDLVPCDLRPPAPTQMQQMALLMEDEIPVDTTPGSPTLGDPKDWDGDGSVDYAEQQDGSWATDMTKFKVSPSIKWKGSTPIANSLIDIKGTENPADNTCAIGFDPVTDEPTWGPCPRRNFTKLWHDGQAGTTDMAGPPPWQLDAIKTHRNPKEKTIVLFVTDGNDTCNNRPTTRCANDGTNCLTGGFPTRARRAAFYAEELYHRLDAAEPASSVTTYMIGYGFSAKNLDFIAWGGSGLGDVATGQPDVDWINDTDTQIYAKRALCTTCVDGFEAPDAEALAATLQALIDRGASEGEFNAQQSITESVFEYVHKVPTIVTDAAMPTERYNGIVPTRFVSSFTLPGFKGHLIAYQSDGASPPNAVSAWGPRVGTVETGDAGYKLRYPLWYTGADPLNPSAPVNPSAPGANITGCPTQGGALASECSFNDLHAGASDATIAGSGAKIKRRIYTTSRNGVYTFDAEVLMDSEDPASPPPGRVTLWPPKDLQLPSDYSSCATLPGGASCSLDEALGLPTSATPTAYPPGSSCAAPTTPAQCWITWLQTELKACVGSNLPGACTTSSTKLLAARKEAREISLALLAGATPVLEGVGLKRISSGSQRYGILYRNREWILADSELATAAVVTPPSLSEPSATPYVSEYKLYRDGVRTPAGKYPNTSDTQIRQGFGLTQPDDDQSVGDGEADTDRPSVKPVMTVVYAPANDGLHAFRAGPCSTPAMSTACKDTGGEELWNFVPYDQLHTLLLRAANEPQGRDNHVYSLVNGVRFADVFVPKSMPDKTIDGVTVSMQGVWRRILYFGRGIGGKYVTALDVTSPGPYTTPALSTVAPIPLWSRGNPDTRDGKPGGTLNNDTSDFDAYRHMGETWSMPTIAYVKPLPAYRTSRRSGSPCPGPNCIDFVLFMGSGYGNPATYGDATTREGTTHYTLDALTGDVIFTADVGERAGETHPNAIVANSVSFNRSAFENLAEKVFNTNPHPWSVITTRVYVGDIHGRLWKFLVGAPGTAIPAADLGSGQPIGVPVALLGEPQVPGDKTSIVPNIFVTTGADRRVEGPFLNVSLIDRGDDVNTSWTGPLSQTTGPPDGGTVSYFPPVEARFSRYFAEGTAVTDCAAGAPKAVFRGTIQPTSAVQCETALNGSTCEGALLQRVFYGGTRLSPPGTQFAPPTPLACGGTCNPSDPDSICYPCRSQFDSILYAVGVSSGEAAYDLNSSGDDAYRIFRDSRIAAISFQADPNPGQGGSRFATDEGLIKGAPKPPPPPGVPPTTTVAGSSVILWQQDGQPAPVVQYGSTVCQ